MTLNPKFCRRCKETKPASEFTPRRAVCKSCRNTKFRADYAENKHRWRLPKDTDVPLEIPQW